MNIEGSVMVYDMYILSETEIEGHHFMDMSGIGLDCQITTQYTVTLDE